MRSGHMYSVHMQVVAGATLHRIFIQDKGSVCNADVDALSLAYDSPGQTTVINRPHSRQMKALLAMLMLRYFVGVDAVQAKHDPPILEELLSNLIAG